MATRMIRVSEFARINGTLPMTFPAGASYTNKTAAAAAAITAFTPADIAMKLEAFRGVEVRVAVTADLVDVTGLAIIGAVAPYTSAMVSFTVDAGTFTAVPRFTNSPPPLSAPPAVTVTVPGGSSGITLVFVSPPPASPSPPPPPPSPPPLPAAGRRRRRRLRSVIADDANGRAVQVDPIKPTLKPTGTKRLKVKCDILLSTCAFKFVLRRYTTGRCSTPPPRR